MLLMVFSVDHLERDLNQKRSLVDEYRLRLSQHLENAEADADIMVPTGIVTVYWNSYS